MTTYLKNIVTEYDLNNGTFVTYYPNGVTTSPLQSVAKLQVPFLLDYQRGTGTNPSSTAIKRQWIQQNVDPSTGLPSYTEYMTEWDYADSKPGDSRLGLTTSQFPVGLAIPGLSTFNWQSPAYPDPTTNADDDAYLDPAATTVSQQPAWRSDAAVAGLPAGPTLVTVADATAALTAAQAATPVDATLVANLTTIKADWALAQTRKSNVTNALANVAFAQEAVAKVGTFFGGLPGGVVSTETVTAPPVVEGVTPNVTVAIANDYGRVPTGDVTLTVGGVNYTQPVAANAASFTLPKYAAGSYSYTLNYPGDDQILAFTKAGTLVVNPAAVKPAAAAAGAATAPLTPPVATTATSKLTADLTVKPTTTTAGKCKVTVATASGLAEATGKVTLELKKGTIKKTVTDSLSGGSVTVPVPKLQAGLWSVAITYQGDAKHQSVSTSGSFMVGKAKVNKVTGAFAVKPISTKAGKYTVTVATPTGLAKPTGKVTVELKKGSVTKILTGPLSGGSITTLVPRLPKGTWSIVFAWPGDANYSGCNGQRLARRHGLALQNALSWRGNRLGRGVGGRPEKGRRPSRPGPGVERNGRTGITG